MSLNNLIFVANVIVFVICVIIQKRAMVPMAFGRGIFITIAMFVFTGLVYIAPSAPRFLVWLLFILSWGFTLMMTFYALNRRKVAKQAVK